jgi:diaminopimelate decarboxylase
VDFFEYKNGELHCEDSKLSLLAERYGTPSYIYSQSTLLKHCRRLLKAFSSYPTTACFAVKSNSNHTVLKTIFAEGFGADLVSAGELQRSISAGVDPGKIVFSGVGKLDSEILMALDADIMSFNVESEFELHSIARLAAVRNKVARVCLRINPNIDAKTNEKIATGLYSTKFGIPETELKAHLQIIKNSPNLKLIGIACHIGSQITELTPLKEAAQSMAAIAKDVLTAGFPIELVDMGGGLGIRYSKENAPELEDYAKTLIDAIRPTGLKLVIEPGRVLVGNIGILLTQVIGVKKTPQKNFVIVDAAMNDLMRPTLYGSYHDIVPVNKPSDEAITALCDFVGPICETGDYLGKDRTCAVPKADDLFAIRGCGAYAAIMSGNYNSRAMAPEIMVEGSKERVIRRRQLLTEIWQYEMQE